MTINDSWGVNAQDENHKSAQQLIRTLVRAASAGANYLLNVGPTALGEILPVHAERLRAMGKWLAIHGYSVYGTQAGIVPPAADGSTVSTHRAGKHYVHALHYISDCVMLCDVPVDVTRATLLRDGSPVKLTTKGENIVLTIPPHQRDVTDTVICLER